MLFICSACDCRSSSRGRCCNIWLLSAVRLLRALTPYPHSLVSNNVHSFLLSSQELPLTDACGCPRQGPLISNRGLMSLFVRSCSPFVRLIVALSGSLFFPLFVHRVGRFCEGWGRCLVMKAAAESYRKPWNLRSLWILEFWQHRFKSPSPISHSQRCVCCIYRAFSITNTPLKSPYFNWQLAVLQYIPLMESKYPTMQGSIKAWEPGGEWIRDPDQPAQIRLLQPYFCADVAATVQMYSQRPSPPRHGTSSRKTCQPGSFKTPEAEAIYEFLKLFVSKLLWALSTENDTGFARMSTSMLTVDSYNMSRFFCFIQTEIFTSSHS